MEFVSIIIPVFNSEPYLGKCIESVIRQTYTKWELILVDDGSSDNSYDICDKYAKTDARIKCIHTTNQGRVHARKTGMRNASGNVIAFMDSDDWIEPEMLRDFITNMQENKADCVIAGYIETTAAQEKSVYNAMPAYVYAGKALYETFFKEMLCCCDYFEFGIQPFLWNKLFRREIIEDAIMETDERLVIGEDVVCVFSALLKAKAVSVMEKAYYHYCIHTGSTMKVYRESCEEFENIRIQYRQMDHSFMRSGFYAVMQPQMNRYLMHHLFVRALPCFERVQGINASFPFEEMIEGSRVILYGAGAFGVSTYRYWMQNGLFEICAWCDGAYGKYKDMEYPVQSPQEAVRTDFDYIVITVLKRASAMSIRKSLIAAQIVSSKIKWLDMEILDRCDFMELGM